MLLLTGSQSAKSDKINYILNTLILIGPGILAIVYPQVGKLAGLLGAIGGLLCIYVLPTITFLAQKRTQINNPDLINALRLNTYSIPVSQEESAGIPTSPKIAIPKSPLNSHQDIIGQRKNTKESIQTR